MNKITYKRLIVVFSLTCLIALFSCRKKDERYEGNYSGLERYTVLDSGATELSTDSTYNQELTVTYKKKFYNFARLESTKNSYTFTIDKDLFINHKHSLPNDIYTDENGNTVGGNIEVEFAGDSVFMSTTEYLNGELSTWIFRGKR